MVAGQEDSRRQVLLYYCSPPPQPPSLFTTNYPLCIWKSAYITHSKPSKGGLPWWSSG